MSSEDFIKELASMIDTGTAPDENSADAKNFADFMNVKDFIKKLSELMDTDAELTLWTKLADLEDWDSLSMVSFYSFCTTQGRTVTADQIKSAQTVEDLFKLAGGQS